MNSFLFLIFNLFIFAQYNTKLRSGRGFTLEELKAAGITARVARTVGIAVDHRRSNKSEESLQLNAQRLKEYKARLVVFPRKTRSPKKGDASAEEIKNATQLHGTIVAAPKAAAAVTFTAVTQEMKDFKAFSTLRNARNDARMVGNRLTKKGKKAEGADKGAAAAAGDDN